MIPTSAAAHPNRALGGGSGAQPILSAMARTAAVASQTDRRHVVGRLRGLSVILPCHDEAQNVERAIDEATAAGELVADAHEIVVVDDGSSHATREPAQARADVDCAFKLMRRDLVQALPLAAEGAMVSTELVTRAHEAGARIAELGVGHRPRVAGRSSGASPRVVLRAFRELRAVRAELREGTP